MLDDKAEEVVDMVTTGDDNVDDDETNTLDEVDTGDCDTGGVVVAVDFKEVVDEYEGNFVAGPVLGVDIEEPTTVALFCCIEEDVDVD